MASLSSAGKRTGDTFDRLPLSNMALAYQTTGGTRSTGLDRVISGDTSVEHAVIGGTDVLLVLHNDGAENFELARAPIDATGTRLAASPKLLTAA